MCLRSLPTRLKEKSYYENEVCIEKKAQLDDARTCIKLEGNWHHSYRICKSLSIWLEVAYPFINRMLEPVWNGNSPDEASLKNISLFQQSTGTDKRFPIDRPNEVSYSHLVFP